MTLGDNSLHLLTTEITGSALGPRFAMNQDIADEAQALLMAQA